MSRVARLIACVLLLLAGQSTDYRTQVESYRKGRESRINGVTGATALVGLHWLTNGTHTVGRGASNDIVLAGPSAPLTLGTIVVTDGLATLRVAPGVAVRVDDKPSAVVEFDPAQNTEVTADGMTFTVIKRARGLALRVWDDKAAARAAFRGLTWYAIDPAWKIDAAFVPHTPGPVVHVLDVLGEIVDMPNPGAAIFTVADKEYRLEALVDPDNADALFFPFRDATNNTTTYGAGRYFYVSKPKNGRVTLDFNYALNPPCAFSEFTTCPVAPASNRLSLSVTAGEQYKR
jgi:uncharacterized protein (DUF1684 family)